MNARPSTTVLPTITQDTPIGRLALAASDTGLARCTFRIVRIPDDNPVTVDGSPAAGWLDLARRELDAYFAGQLRNFTVPVDLRRLSGLHRRVLERLGDVGYGTTTTYGRLAAALGLTDDGPRQIGGAMARNPVLVIVPCHRVLGAAGGLVGYAGGLDAKHWLLNLEAQDRAPKLDLAW